MKPPKAPIITGSLVRSVVLSPAEELTARELDRAARAMLDSARTHDWVQWRFVELLEGSKTTAELLVQRKQDLADLEDLFAGR
jgi:acyl-CoA reductase-like NAD-dependent aldehyde dehydrogenase